MPHTSLNQKQGAGLVDTSSCPIMCNSPSNSGAVIRIEQIIRLVISLTVKAELDAFFINVEEEVQMQTTSQEMGHSQPLTPVQTDNSTAHCAQSHKGNGHESLFVTEQGTTTTILILLAAREDELC